MSKEEAMLPEYSLFCMVRRHANESVRVSLALTFGFFYWSRLAQAYSVSNSVTVYIFRKWVTVRRSARNDSKKKTNHNSCDDKEF
jgi:hypothetical protein